MRLIKRLDAMEERAAAAAAAERPSGKVMVCWSTREERVADGDLAPGDFVACDVHYLDPQGPERDVARYREEATAEELEFTPCVRIVERITRDARDLGVVYDETGVRVGVVVELDGSMLTLRHDAVEGQAEAGGPRVAAGDE